MSCAWKEPRCRIGLILGTGTNACYLEEIKDIHTINQGDFEGQRHMLVNTEWQHGFVRVQNRRAFAVRKCTQQLFF